MYNRRFTPDEITHLEANEIFVFGSNLSGMHGGGAARVAHKSFGAEWGVGVGLTGRSYAIPTMQGGVDTIRPYVDEFIEFAKQHSELTFLVTRIGCGIAGFKDLDIAHLFAAAIDVENIILPKSFVSIIQTAERYANEMSTMKFEIVKFKLYPEDEAKLATMSRKEMMEFMREIRQQKRYIVVGDDEE